jgi:hypothetical protein
MFARSRLGVALAAAAIVSTACSGTAPSSTPAAPPASLQAATPNATIGSSSPSPTSVMLVPIDVDLTPGTYSSRFDPGFTFTVVQGKFIHDEPTAVNYGYGVGGGDPAEELFMVPITTGDIASLMSAIRKLPGMTVVTAPKAVKVGGRDAIQMDIASGSSDLQLKPAGADLGFPPQSTIRLIAVTVGEKPVLIGYLHHGDSKAGFPEAVSVFQPFVDSIVWE